MTKWAVGLCRKGCNCNLQEYKGKVSFLCEHASSFRDLFAGKPDRTMVVPRWELEDPFSFEKCSEPAGGKVHSKPCRCDGTVKVGDECASRSVK